MGSSRAWTPKRRATSAVTCDRVAPAAEAARPEQVRGQVPVPEVEPGEVGCARPARLFERLAAASMTVQDSPDKSPAGAVVGRPGQGVGDRVDVGADVQAVQHHVVARVDNGGDRRLADNGRQAPQHPGSPDPAGQGGDPRGVGSTA